MLERGFVVVPTGVALVAVLVVCFVRRTGARRTCLYLALTAYVGAVAAVTLFPLPVEGGMGYAPTWGISYNLVPFAGIARTVADAAQTGWWWSIATIIVGGNVLMFVPLGLMLPLLSDRLRRLPAAALVLAACSVAIELAQLVVGLAVAGYLYRVVDVDDVILNVAGGLIGFGLWKAWERLAAPKRDELV
ncbi:MULTISPECIES: VanZ family protein [Gordonibacter]|jgi:glycopeptide antibiotics resistance protein|uniref:VanZ-like domain-containing protein n=1 Tax=Gordonibacter urolithinfaciens TaxID=1335613 RepID=A0A7K0IC03_9ACTN|nr:MULTISPECIES: VanZ family protein [Gordonibacter]MBS6975484.1 VanZ family protein [Eggerthellaceae bacterium]MCB6562055.1 VanZ family protein [Gordonibacter urolithinfaciens]MCB7086433.1 VanZ family protein [Gordonibacter urolithinfaciens]MDN4470845.1 VanZ family protein [Gordonibacter sp. RACS_AR68]MSA95599.1 hypothetical protein [Gordonibacter urolithinfaciens]